MLDFKVEIIVLKMGVFSGRIKVGVGERRGVFGFEEGSVERCVYAVMVI